MTPEEREKQKKNIQAMVDAGEIEKYSREYFSLYGKMGSTKKRGKYWHKFTPEQKLAEVQKRFGKHYKRKKKK